MNIWTILFIASLAQAIFLIAALPLGRRLKSLPSRILFCLLVFVALINFEYLLIAGGGYRSFPHVFGFSFGLLFLIGPSLLVYTRSILDPLFRIRPVMFLHLILFAAYYVFAIPLFGASAAEKIDMIEFFVHEKIAIRSFDYLLFVLQLGHILSYIVVAHATIRTYRASERFRLKPNRDLNTWIRIVLSLFTGFALLLFVVYVVFALSGYYTIAASYTYALSYSIIIYIIAGALFFKPRVVLGEDPERYRNSNLTQRDVDNQLSKLSDLMNREKPFLRPELTLAEVADRLAISHHALSEIINKGTGRSFVDYLNGFRVEEFKRRLADPNSKKYTLLTLAMDAGFNSKSAFNTAFKKATGSTPREYRTSLSQENS